MASCHEDDLHVVLILARRNGSNVNSLIINQTVMDLLSCVAVVANHLASRHVRFAYRDHGVVDNIVCIFVEGSVVTAVGLSAAIVGLVVITLERYVKIVHAVAHRKFYRDWMTSVGVALPWISALGVSALPTIGTTRVVNGRCLRYSVWPNKGMAKVRCLYALNLVLYDRMLVNLVLS